MGTNKLAGFTIIETTLFLGISSFLIVALIASTGNSINIQRYNDAVETFKSVLQQQYADVASVQNSRNDNWSCGSTANPTTTGTVKDNRGQSECSLVGKYVRIEDDKLSIYRVVAYESATPATPATSANDIISLKDNYVLNVSQDDMDSSTMEWGTRISYPATQSGAPYSMPQNPRKMGILIVRSPDSGQVYTFTNSDSDVPDDGSIGSANLESMLVAGGTIPGQSSRLICVNSSGLLANNDRAINLGAFASGSSAVEMQTNDYLISEGSAYKC